MMSNHNTHTCEHCGRNLENIGGLWICTSCNDSRGEFYGILADSINAFADTSDRILITCPGATLYKPGSNEVVAGVRFNDSDDPSAGYEIIGRPVYGPKHVEKRWIKKEDAHLIRRCQSCQDHTVRMRRKEGPDLYIPSRKGPRRPQRNRGDNYSA